MFTKKASVAHRLAAVTTDAKLMFFFHLRYLFAGLFCFPNAKSDANTYFLVGFTGVMPVFVGVTGMILPRLSNFIRSIHTSL